MTLLAARPVAPAEGPRYPTQSTYKRGEVAHISPPWPLPGPPSIEAPPTPTTHTKPITPAPPPLKADEKRLPASLEARQHRARKVFLGGWSGDGGLEDPDSNSTNYTVSTLTSSVFPHPSQFVGSSMRSKSSKYSTLTGKRSMTPLSASMLTLSRERRSTMDLQIERMECGIEEYHKRLIEERKQRRTATMQARELAASLQQAREELERTQMNAKQLEEQFVSMLEQNAVLELQLAIAHGAADDAEMRYREERDAGALVYTWYTELMMELAHLQGQPCTTCAHGGSEEQVPVAFNEKDRDTSPPVTGTLASTNHITCTQAKQNTNTNTCTPGANSKKAVVNAPNVSAAAGNVKGGDVSEKTSSAPRKSWGKVWERVAAYKAAAEGSECGTPTSATQGVKLLGCATPSVKRGVVGRRVSALENKA